MQPVCRCGKLPHGVELTGASETISGVRKSIRIELYPTAPIVRLVHTVVNESSSPLSFAPWAITQFCQGGTVLLPQPVGNTDPHGLLSNRLLVLWPYTRINDPRLVLRDDFILVHADAALPPVKLGYANRAGWLAYWRNGLLFRKSFDLHPGAAYPDGGCNAEVYCGDRFVELESLGIAGSVQPGQSRPTDRDLGTLSRPGCAVHSTGNPPTLGRHLFTDCDSHLFTGCDSHLLFQVTVTLLREKLPFLFCTSYQGWSSINSRSGRSSSWFASKYISHRKIGRFRQEVLVKQIWISIRSRFVPRTSGQEVTTADMESLISIVVKLAHAPDFEACLQHIPVDAGLVVPPLSLAGVLGFARDQDPHPSR